MSRRTIMLASALALLGVQQTFAAPVADDTPTYRVRFDDLNLESLAGRKSLYSRVDGAARVVCRNLESSGAALRDQHKRCLREAVARAVLKINDPRVTEYYSAHNHGKMPADVLPAQESKGSFRSAANSR